MKETLSKMNDWVTLITKVGVGLIALSVVVEIVFGKKAMFGASVITNLTNATNEIGGTNGFVGLVAILVILALVRGRISKKA